jgi:hypothetical protein
MIKGRRDEDSISTEVESARALRIRPYDEIHLTKEKKTFYHEISAGSHSNHNTRFALRKPNSAAYIPLRLQISTKTSITQRKRTRELFSQSLRYLCSAGRVVSTAPAGSSRLSRTNCEHTTSPLLHSSPGAICPLKHIVASG